jgi:hypothetical protein
MKMSEIRSQKMHFVSVLQVIVRLWRNMLN